jgi:RHS repeat-associated protein
MDNTRRITSRTLDDGQRPAYTWTYSYGTPNVNSLGTDRGPQSPWNYGNWGTTAFPNSAALYYNAFTDVLHDYQSWLAHKPLREFRGHDWVQETDPNGGRVKHYFRQGEAYNQCKPTATGGSITSDTCFQALVNGEFLKGKEYKTQVLPATGSALLQETIQSFGVAFYDYTSTPLSGLWRAFSWVSQTDLKQYETAGTSVVKTTKTFYNTGCTADTPTTITASYGNAGCVQELLGSTLVRKTLYWYVARDDAGGYIVDRAYQDATYDVNGYLLALTNSFYDGTSVASAAPTLGDLRRVSRYEDIPPNTSDTTGITLHSQDTTFTYDTYGNQTKSTSYAGAGTRLFDGTGTDWSAPGAGSAARDTNTSYDSVFHAFATQQSNPLSQLTRVDYDERMGTLIRVTGPNTTGTPTNCAAASFTIPASEESSCAQYDVFGRMIALVKPGDSSSVPTLQAFYSNYDSASGQPYRYVVYQREVAGNAATRATRSFYDGMGRKIQTKIESQTDAQSIVTDTRFDGLGNPIAQSQPRYVNETTPAIYNYTDPGSGALYRLTATTYDALNRVRVVTAPDTTTSSTTYSLGSLGTIAATIDANNHKTERESDMFGRLRTVREYSGAGTFTLYATTSYAYTALDQLKTATDAAGNVTTLTYNSAGRKTRTVDRDMGTWDYTYDASGNLVTQADGRTPRQTIWFGYDVLNRLTQKRQTSSGGALLAQYTYDQTSATNKGIGKRTAMSVPSGASTSYEYDARGRKTTATHTVPGLSGTRVFSWGYDSGDRLTTLTYPVVGGVTEQLTYSYDAAWRPTQVCSNRSGAPCYARLATYTALSQPEQWTLNNNLVQDWVYSSPMQRLAQLKVGPGTPASIFDRSYGYDNASNVTAITDNKASTNNQTFGYDHRDRLTSWTLNGTAQSYTYNTIGNLTSKAGVTYTYPASGASSVRPHTPSQVGATAYTYDGNGNLANDGGRGYTWNIENLPTQVTHVSGNETYSYDADGERVKKVKGSTTTVYLEGLWEEVAGGATKVYYQFSGQVVAVRDTSSGVVTYLHSDHLGSVSVATSQSQGIANQQEYDAWGKVRSGSMAATSRNYTGQVLDLTGLLYYHARMYDPNLGRFVSADSIVPGAASGKEGGAATLGMDTSSQLAPLAVDFHEVGFVATLNGENAFRAENGFWFQLDNEGRQQAKSPWGPQHPQALNRYSYVLNNPLRYVDPSGHIYYGGDQYAGYRTVCGTPDGQRAKCGSSGASPVTDPTKGELVETWTYDFSDGSYHYTYYWSSSPEFAQFKDFADKARAAKIAAIAYGGTAIIGAGAAAMACPASPTIIGAIACGGAVIGTIVTGAAAIGYLNDWIENLRNARLQQRYYPGQNWPASIIRPHDSHIGPYSQGY